MATTLSIRPLTIRLRRFFEHSPQAREQVANDTIVKGDFRVDLRSHRVTVCNRPVELSPEEFDLLLFLLSHQRRIVTPRTLLNTRWGDQEVAQSDFLRVLGTLRGKIEQAGGRTGYIRTEPWIFYRFDPGP